MANPDQFSNTSKPYNLRTSTWTLSQNIAGNYSTLRTQIWVDRLSTQYAFSGGEATRVLRIDGTVVADNYGTGFDFSGAGPWLILQDDYNVTHDADGTKSVAVRADAVYDILGSAIATSTYTPATIPRASVPTLSDSTPTTGQTITINTNRASSSFTHNITYSFQGQTGTIGTGVGASDTWTPPASLFNVSALDDKTSASGTITVVTKSGSTTVGTKSVAFTLTLANDSTGQPTWSSVSAAEGTTSPNVNTLVGKLVQNISKVTGTISGATGVQGSTITSKKFTVAGQAVTVSGTSATTPSPISTSGTQNVAFEITDTRGRKKTQNVSIDVLPYTTPKATNIAVYRAGASGTTADPQGTRLAVTMSNATVQSLMNSTEKNLRTVRVYSSPHDANTWTLRGTPVNASTTLSGAVSLGWGAVGDYPLNQSFDVKIEVEDVFGSTSRATYIGTVATGVIFQHWGTGLGLGKFWEEGMLDVAGDGYFKAGNGGTGKIVTEGTGTFGGSIGITGGIVASSSITGTRVITNAGDASLAGTAGVTVGPDSGVNLALDSNEVQGRNNGAASTLSLNIRGGDVNIGASSNADQVNIRGHMNNAFLPWAMAAGTVASAANSGSAAPVYWDGGVTVTLPASRFNVTPIITATAYAAGQVLGANVISASSTSFLVRTIRFNASVSGSDVYWQAVQMTSSAAGG